MCWNDFLSNMW